MEEQLINIASEMTKRYWETGNIITAFGVVQLRCFSRQLAKNLTFVKGGELFLHL
jgi:hypothetical protein